MKYLSSTNVQFNFHKKTSMPDVVKGFGYIKRYHSNFTCLIQGIYTVKEACLNPYD